MTILETTRQIIQKHKLEEKLPFNPFKDQTQNYWLSDHFKDSQAKTEELAARYESRIPIGWYGFDCSCWPISWMNALEEFLAELERDSPDFEIHQVKLKFSSARIYLNNLSAEAWKAVNELENAMQDDNLYW